MLKKALILLSLTIYTTCEWQQIETHGPHYTNLHKNPYVLLVMYDPRSNAAYEQTARSALTNLNTVKELTDQNIVFEFADCSVCDLCDKYYKLDKKNGLRFFIKRQMVTMDDFHEQMEQVRTGELAEEKFAENVQNLVLESINGIATEINTTTELRQRMDEHKIIGLYLGEKNDNFRKFMLLARNNIDFDFFYSFDVNVKKEVYMTMSGLVVPEGDSFAVVRHESLINNMDPLTVTYITDFASCKRMTVFFNFERFPKLRTNELANKSMGKIFQEAQKMILYTRPKNKTAEEQQNYNNFREAVKVLKKELIFAVADAEKQVVSDYMVLFMHAQMGMADGQVYAIYVAPDGQAKIEQMNGPLGAMEIVGFVNQFVEKNQPLFDSMGRHLYDEDEWNDKELVSEEL